MCFTIPKKVIKRTNNQATIEGGQIIDVRDIGGVRVGDYLMVTHGVAVAKVDARAGQSARAVIKKSYDEIQ